MFLNLTYLGMVFGTVPLIVDLLFAYFSSPEAEKFTKRKYFLQLEKPYGKYC
jgi:hypothetical protein